MRPPAGSRLENMNIICRRIKLFGKLGVCLAAIFPLVAVAAPALGFFPQPPLNDSFAVRTVFASPFPGSSATNFAVWGNLSNTTSEVGEPFIDGVSSGQTVWGTWTPPNNGVVTLTIEAETFSPLLSVYAGSAPITGQNQLGVFPGNSTIATSTFTNLSLIASNNYLICYEHAPCGCHWRERNHITFHVVRGQEYQFCVDSAIITDASLTQQSISIGNGFAYLAYVPTFTTNFLAGGSVILNLHFDPAPPNDDFTNRTKLTGGRIATNLSNVGATMETNEPDNFLPPLGGSSVWYSWTAPASGRVTLATNEIPPYSPPASSAGGGYGSVTTIINFNPPTCGAEIDQHPPPIFYPVFSVFTGTEISSLTNARALLKQLPAYPHAVEFNVIKGQTYQISFDGNQGTTGRIPFYLALTTPPPNDDLKHAIVLHGVSVEATGYNAGATSSLVFGQPGAGLPPPVFFQNRVRYTTGRDVWWSWIAPVAGEVKINLAGSDYPFPVAVSELLHTKTNVVVSPIINLGHGEVTFTAIQGKTYLIRVLDYEGLTGAIQLSLQAPIIDLPLHPARRGKRMETPLPTDREYDTTPGVIAGLIYSVDNVRWQLIQTKLALGSTVSFRLKHPPTPTGPYYRAIIFDRVSLP